jgi:hypothetical protein
MPISLAQIKKRPSDPGGQKSDFPAYLAGIRLCFRSEMSGIKQLISGHWLA